MDTIQAIKQRFEIIGNEPKRDRKAIQVPTDISVLVVGESGVEKKVFQNSHHRKHGSTLP
jgi:transcriptional regulator with PAS, ATPase and Fis domain